jgi:transcriptional regulator with XRE-family HTH domain
MYFTSKFGLKLRAVRRSQGLPLMALRARTGGKLAKSGISNYEQGIRRRGLAEAAILADVPKTVTPTYLYVP